MKLLNALLVAFLNQAQLNMTTVYDDPALNQLITVLDGDNAPDLKLFEQTEAGIEFGIATGDPTYATHILSLQKSPQGKDCLVLAWYNDKDITDVARFVIGDNPSDEAKRLLRLFELNRNRVTSFENLVERCLMGQDDYFILLAGGTARSSKSVALVDDEITSLDFANLPADLELSIFNDIDESVDIVTRETIGEKTNIMNAIDNEAFFAY